jgi:biopolymer transport protein ExbB
MLSTELADLKIYMAENPGAVIEDVARQRKVTPRAVIEALPSTMARIGRGGEFAAAMQDIAQWGEVTLIVHTDDAIFEFTGAIPAGEIGRGYFNLMQPKGLHGHLRHERCGAIAFVERPSWENRRRSSRSSMSTAASCSRCSSVATRRVPCAAINSNAFIRWRTGSRRTARPEQRIRAREATMQRSLRDARSPSRLKVACLIAFCAALLPGTGFAATDAALLPRNLSPWGMFVNADVVVKAVMIGLALASLLTWTVWLAKTIELGRKTVVARRRLGVLESDTTLAEVARQSRDANDGVAQLIQSAARETSLSGGIVDDGLKERIALRLERVEAAMSRQIARGTGVLATIGATAPFVGLFGTVWGIMNSFIGISEAHTTNLAVVAPGIAEALLATALGLVAAIPAVVIYNHLARSIASHRALLGDASAQVLLLVSRQRDHRAFPMARAAE